MEPELLGGREEYNFYFQETHFILKVSLIEKKT